MIVPRMGMIMNTPGVSKVLSGIQESMRMKKLWAVRSSDFDNIFENCYASCNFGLAKDI